MNTRIFQRLAYSALVCGLVMNAHAMGNGFYMGAMGGFATNNGNELQAQIKTPGDVPTSTTTPVSPRSTQYAGRIFIGNQFNKYAAFEGGATLFSEINYDTKGVETCSTARQRVRDLDVVVKGILPFYYGFDVYGKAGFSVTYVTTSGCLNPWDSKPSQNCKNVYNNRFAPTYSVGASYDINQSWGVDLSYNVIQVGQSVGNVSLAAIGLSYHFTDKYCGQFLCDD